MRNFKQLLIWQKGFQISIGAFNLVSSFPKEERFSLSNQITGQRFLSLQILQKEVAAVVRKITRFLELPLGSSYELETQILIAGAVNYGDESIRNKLLQSVQDEQKMLAGFMTKLSK